MRLVFTLMCLATSDLHDPATSHLLLLECELCLNRISVQCRMQCIRSTSDHGTGLVPAKVFVLVKQVK
jgi:hypothetical protein